MSEAAVSARVPESPYKGLAPFEDNAVDALLFFGREREQEVIASNLLAARLTVLYGPSGVGKSSVLRAGVAYRLRRAAEEAIEEHGHPGVAVVVFDDWRGDVLGALRAAVEHELGRLFGPYTLPAVEPNAPLAEALQTWSSALDCELLLILDQLEEYFVYHPEEPEEGGFADELAELVTAPGLRARVLLSLREDALAKLDRFKARIPRLFSNYLRLDRLQPEAARAAVLGPLERYNELVGPDAAVSIEPALVDAVVDETAAGRVDLGETGRPSRPRELGGDGVETAYLQLVLARVWDEELKGGSRTLRLETLHALGGAGEIVRTHVRRALDDLEPVERDVAATIFNYLVTPSGTKIAHALSDLQKYSSAPAHRVDAVVAALSRERVLRSVAAPGGNGNGSSGRGYEIFHDVLADAVLAWRRRHEEERALERERRQAARRQRILAAVSGASLAALAVMAAVTVFAFSQRQEAQEQAAIAAARSEQALDARARANEALRRAERQKARAERLAAEAKDARHDAEEAAHEATLQAERADDNAKAAEESEAAAQASLELAKEQEAKAEQAADQAEASEEEALAALADAEEHRKRAVAANADAQRSERSALEAKNEALAEKRRADARRLTADAFARLSTDPEQSVRSALAAAALERTPEVEQALRHALLASHGRAVLRGGGGVVRHVAFSPDGTFVATAAMRGDVRVFDVASRRLVRTLPHPGAAVELAFSPDGVMLATASHDGAARIWNFRTGTVVHTLRHDLLVRHVAYSPDGRWLVTGSNDRTVRVWDAVTGLEAASRRHEAPITSIAVSPSSRLLATVAGNRFTNIFPLPDGLRIARLSQQGEVTSTTFSPDEATFVTTSRDQRVRLWDAHTWRARDVLEGHPGQVLDAAFSEDGELLATADTDGVVRVWDVATGGLSTVLLEHRVSVHHVRFTPERPSTPQAIVTASEDGVARVWTPDGTRNIDLLRHRDEIEALAVSPSGAAIATGSEDGTARLWDARVDELLRPLATHAGAVGGVAFSPDGRRILSFGGRAAIVAPVGRGRSVALPQGGTVTDAAFSRDGRLLLTAGDDGRVHVRDRSGRLVRTLGHGAAVTTAKFGVERGLVLTGGSDGRALLWRGRRIERTIRHAAPVTVASFSPDGEQALTVAGADAFVSRLRDGRRVSLRGHTDAIVAAAFSPRGRLVVTASADETAIVWDAATGERVKSLAGEDGHTGPLTSIEFSSDGTRVVTASRDSNAIVWNPRTGRRVALLRGHSSVVADASFSADGRWVSTAGPIAAGLWDARTGELLFFVRGYRLGSGVAFSPVENRIATAATDGTVKTYDCRMCGRLPQLLRIARTQLRQLRPSG